MVSPILKLVSCRLRLQLPDVGVVYQIEQRDRGPDHNTGGKSQQTNNIANALDSLLLVYNDARTAFHSLPPRSIAATQAAKFLRDTAENLVHYIRSLQVHESSGRLPPLSDSYHSKILDELLGTILRTSKFVERSSGGKKRSWEQSDERGRNIGSLVSQHKKSVPQYKKSASQLKESVSQHNNKLRRGKGRTRRHGSVHVSPDERAKLTSNLRQETFLSHFDPSRSYCFHRAVSEDRSCQHMGQSTFMDQDQSIYMGQSTFVGQSTFMSVADTYRPKYEYTS